MRKIRINYNVSTDRIVISTLENLTRGKSYPVELRFRDDEGLPVLLPEDATIFGVMKRWANGAPLVTVPNWTRPTEVTQPYTATMHLVGEELGAEFVDAFSDHELDSVALTFELSYRESSGLEKASEKVALMMSNEYGRNADEGIPEPIAPDVWKGDDRYIRHDSPQALEAEQQAQARENLGITGGGQVNTQVFEVGAGTWVKPEGAVWVEGLVVGGGGGAASGYTQADAGGSYNVVGGAGSQAGAVMAFSLPASALSAEEAVVVGAGGAGGVYAGTGFAAGADGGSSSFNGLTAIGGKGSTNSSGVAEQSEKCLYSTVMQPSSRSMLASGSGGGAGSGGDSGGALPNTGTALTQRTPTGGGGGGGCQYSDSTGLWSYGKGGGGGAVGGRNQFQTTVAGGSAGSESTAGSNGEDGKLDPVSGFAAGAGGGGGGRLGGGHGGDGAFPGGAAGGGASCRGDDGDLPGNGGSGGNGLVIVRTYCE